VVRAGEAPKPSDNNADKVVPRTVPEKVLLVQVEKHASPLEAALAVAGFQVVRAEPDALPATADAFAPYDCVILDNINYADVSAPAKMAALKKWVQEGAGGLVLIGGDDSFGPGGYTDTVLEELAPVEMDVKRRKRLAPLAQIMMLDKSGSMGMPMKAGAGLQKMQVVEEGVCTAVERLDADDLALVGVCDMQVRWADDLDKLMPMLPANKARIEAATRKVQAGGGGILCTTALTQSYDLLKKDDSKGMSRHVTLFADAQDSDQQEGSVELAKEMFVKFGITTSVIGMGLPTDPHASFQKAVAEAGHGRWFVTEDVNNLGRLFIKDAFITSRQPYIERAEGWTLTPAASPLLPGIKPGDTAALPKVYGYVATTLKPRATLALHGQTADDPVLAHWVTGRGRSVAFTAVTPWPWDKEWATMNGYGKFWAQVVHWVSRPPQAAATQAREAPSGRSP
jgi:Ca-activated chloride channel family protein